MNWFASPGDVSAGAGAHGVASCVGVASFVRVATFHVRVCPPGPGGKVPWIFLPKQTLEGSHIGSL